jgi:fructose-1,6-bisphosphatase
MNFLRKFIQTFYPNFKGKIEQMDKKIHKITEKMKLAEKDIKTGKKKEAVTVLKKAEKKNEKLVKIDRDKRDPIIENAKKAKKLLRKA